MAKDTHKLKRKPIQLYPEFHQKLNILKTELKQPTFPKLIEKLIDFYNTHPQYHKEFIEEMIHE